MRLKESEESLQSEKNKAQVWKLGKKMIPQFESKMHADLENAPSSVLEPLIDRNLIKTERIGGVVDSNEIFRFRKLIFRATKGKAFMYTE